MTPALRVAVVLALVLLVVVVVRLVARWQRPPHPPIDLDGLGDRPGVVVFTSTDCATCAEAMRVVGNAGRAVREVTWELEPRLFEEYRIEAVPLVAVLDGHGRSILFQTGVPDRNRFRRALRSAGIA
jgi:hypothetical protein